MITLSKWEGLACTFLSMSSIKNKVNIGPELCFTLQRWYVSFFIHYYIDQTKAKVTLIVITNDLKFFVLIFVYQGCTLEGKMHFPIYGD